jgi:hypothetical protein
LNHPIWSSYAKDMKFTSFGIQNPKLNLFFNYKQTQGSLCKKQGARL